MILCSPKPVSIIKAAMLSQIHQQLPCCYGEEHQLGLFMHTPSLDADQYSTALLIRELEVECGLDTSWLLQAPGQALGRLVAANLRYEAPDKAVVIFAAIEQALKYGHAYCLCGAGNASRLFIDRSRTISKEVHRMLGFVRFQPGPGDSLIARPKLFHNTADLILRQFALRYPNTRLIFILTDETLVWENNQLFRLPADEFLSYMVEDEFLPAWDTYYQSQYIATRKNIKLASKVIPRKYWGWLAEGKVLASFDL